jgi:predicted nucleotidyltransferase
MERDRHVYSREVKRRLIEDGMQIFKKYKIKKVVLFGSVLENKMCAHSDVDILVDPLSAEHFFTFQCVLEEKLNLPVDLHTMNEDSKFIEKVLERGEVIYEV